MLTSKKILWAFKTRLKALVEKKKVEERKTQEQIAGEIGISKQALSLFLQDNTRMPQADNLLLIADYFNASVDYLLGRSKCKTPDHEAISKRLGLSEEAIVSLENMNQSSDVVDETLKLINEPLIETVNALLSTDQGRRALSYIASYLGGDFSHPFIEMQGSSAYEDDPQLVYPQRIYAKSTIGGPPILIRNEALEESVLAIVSNEFRKLKRQEAKKNGDPED